MKAAVNSSKPPNIFFICVYISLNRKKSAEVVGHFTATKQFASEHPIHKKKKFQIITWSFVHNQSCSDF